MAPETAGRPPCPLCGGDVETAYEGGDLLHGRPGTWSYFRCPACVLDFQHPTPDAATIASYYPPDYEVYAPPEVKAPSGLRRAVLRHRYGYAHLETGRAARVLAPIAGRFRYRDEMPFVPGGLAVDVGCGNGTYLLRLRALGWKVLGVDFSPQAVRVARAAGLDVREGSLEDVALEADSVDLLTARHVVEHFPDPRPFFDEAHRVLGPKGRLVVRTPNGRALARDRFGAFWYPNDIPRHLFVFSARSLEALAGRRGLRRVASKTFSTPKAILNSRDYRRGHTGRPSRHVRWRRWLARSYVWRANLKRRGDELFLVFEKFTAPVGRPGIDAPGAGA
ncbi:MAG: class I SAM-dependent methyltransferase [Planctomycetota bacterium]|jgi:SAM-dependent methyltransferase